VIAEPYPEATFDGHAMDGGWYGNESLSECGSRYWVDMEYLVFRINNGPVPGPLVTTGNPNQPFAGTLGKGNAQVLFGGSNLDYGNFGGTRLTVGYWTTPDHTFGIEVGGFVLEQRSVHFAAASDGTGNPALYIPGFNVVQGEEFKLIVADPVQQFAGSVVWSSQSRLWGMEANGVFGSWCTGDFTGSFLAGFRYLDLEESLQLANSTVDLTDGAVTTLNDNFQTHNQFFGAQIGAKLGWKWNFLTVDVIGKVAVGETHETVDINGVATQSGANAPTPGTFRGGFFAQGTNIGRFSQDQFSVVPEIQVKLGCEIIPGVRAFVGYDLVYWNQVARPGAEIDRGLNLTQSPVSNIGNGSLQGPARPSPLFNHTDYWAEGVSFGLELRY
jgi:hypothetical protein